MVVGTCFYGTILVPLVLPSLLSVNSCMNFTEYQDMFAKNLFASSRRLKLGRK
jgi:hypothetical protein